MSDSAIGLRLADGSFYPIIDSFAGAKKFAVIPAAAEQMRIDIDICVGDSFSKEVEQVLKKITLEREPFGDKIDIVFVIDGHFLVIALNDDEEIKKYRIDIGSLISNTASEAGLAHRLGQSVYPQQMEQTDFYDNTARVRQPVEPRAARRTSNGYSKFVILLFLILLIVGVGFLLYLQFFSGDTGTSSADASKLFDPIVTAEKDVGSNYGDASSAAAGNNNTTNGQDNTETQTNTPNDTVADSSSVSSPENREQLTNSAFNNSYNNREIVRTERYRLLTGDTLWDISNTFYRIPWRYGLLARYNGIIDPDKIYAGSYIVIPFYY